MTSNSAVAEQISEVLKKAQLQIKGWAGMQADRIAIVIEDQNIDELRLMLAIRQTETRLKSQVAVFRTNNLSAAENRKMLSEYSKLDT